MVPSLSSKMDNYVGAGSVGTPETVSELKFAEVPDVASVLPLVVPLHATRSHAMILMAGYTGVGSRFVSGGP